MLEPIFISSKDDFKYNKGYTYKLCLIYKLEF